MAAIAVQLPLAISNRNFSTAGADLFDCKVGWQCPVGAVGGYVRSFFL